MKFLARYRRLVAVLVAGVVLAAVVAGGMWLRQRSVNQRVVEDYARSDALIEEGEFEEALHVIGSYVQRNPDDAEAVFKYGDVRLRVEAPRGRHVIEAATFFGRAAALDPDMLEARSRRLDLLIALGYDTEALAEARALLDAVDRGAAETAEDEADYLEIALTRTAVAQSRLGQSQEAARTAVELADQAPESLAAQSLALDLLRAARGESAVSQRLAALRETGVNSAIAGLLEARHAIGLGRQDRAAELAVQAGQDWLAMTDAADSPAKNQAELAQSIARLLDGLGRYQQADAFLATAADADPELSEAAALRSFYRGDLQAIRTAALAESASPALLFTAASSQTPADPALADRLGAAPTGGPLLRVVRAVADGADEADLEVIDKAIEVHPDLPLLYLWRGAARQELGDVDGALEAWQFAGERAQPWATPWLRSADLLFRSNRTNESAAAAFAALQRGPDEVDAIAAAVRVLTADSINPQIRDRFPTPRELVTRLDPADQPDATATATRVLYHAWADELDEAETQARRLLENTSATADDLFVAAEGLLTERPPLARELLTRVLELDPSDVQAGLRLASSVRRDQGDEAGAALLDGYAGADDSDPFWMLARATYAEATGEADAASHWQRLIDRHASHLPSLRAVLRAESVSNDIDLRARALDALGQEVGEDDAGWQYERARFLLLPKQGESSIPDSRISEATVLLGRAVRANPGFLLARELLGRSLLQLGSESAGAQQLAILADAMPENGTLQHDVGLLFMSLGETTRARPYLERAMDSDDLNADARMRVANAVVALDGDAAVGVEALEQSFGAGEVPASVMAATLYLQAGREEQGVAMLEQLLEQPSPEAVTLAVSVFANRGEQERLDQLLDPAAVAEYGWPEGAAESLRARILFDRGDIAAAAVAAAEAARLAPTNAAVQRLYVNALLIQTVSEDKDLATVKTVAREAADQVEDPGLAALVATLDTVDVESATIPGFKERVLPLLVGVLRDADRQVAVTEALDAVTRASAATPDLARELSSIADRHPQVASVQEVAAAINLEVGRNAEAVRLAQRGSSGFNPDAAVGAIRTRRLTALALAADGRWAESLAAAQRWREVLRDPFEADLLIASCHLNLGDPAAAARVIQPYAELRTDEAAAQSNNRGSRALITLLEARLAQRNADEAADLLRPHLDRPQWRQIWIRLWPLLLDDTASLAWLKEAQEFVPGDANAELLMLADAFSALSARAQTEAVARDALGEARTALEKSADALLGSSDPEVMGMILVVASRLDVQGERDLAASIYRQVLSREDLTPEFVMLTENNLAMILLAEGEYAQALAAAERAATLGESLVNQPEPSAFADANLHSVLDTLARTQRGAGDLDTAIVTFGRALQRRPDATAIIVHLASALVEADRTETARDLMEAAPPMVTDEFDDETRAQLEAVRTTLGLE
jgi:tetratricopeptide (TPR) repeat protein